MSVSGGSSSFLATTLPFSAFTLLVAGSSSGRSGSRFLSLSPSSPLSLTGGAVTSPLASIVATTGGSNHCSGLVPATADLGCEDTHERTVCELWWIVSYCCPPCSLFSLPMKFSFGICLPSMTAAFGTTRYLPVRWYCTEKTDPAGECGACPASPLSLDGLTGRRQMRWNGQFPAES